MDRKGTYGRNPCLYFAEQVIGHLNWKIYEVDFPESSNMKAPRGFRFSLWSLSFFSALHELLLS